MYKTISNWGAYSLSVRTPSNTERDSGNVSRNIGLFFLQRMLLILGFKSVVARLVALCKRNFSVSSFTDDSSNIKWSPV